MSDPRFKRDAPVRLAGTEIIGRLDTDPFPAIDGMYVNVVWTNAEPRYQCVKVDRLTLA
jgi:hypothetical protein